jgi:glycosyltransferase involved in cell wall biosynthesis
MKPLISVIVPVFNTETYVGAAIDSVIGQRYPNWELLLVDDGSADGSGAICDRYAQNNGRIAAYHIPNDGVSAARNYGLERAGGEYVCFLDSDDLLTPDHLQNLYSHIGGADVAVCGMRTVGDTPREHVHNYFANRMRNGRYTLAGFKRDVLRTWFPPYIYTSCNKLFRRALMERHALRFPEGQANGEDTVFVLRYLSASKVIRCCSARTYVIRVRRTSASRKFNQSNLSVMLRTYDDIDAFFSVSDRTNNPLIQCYRIGPRLEILSLAALGDEHPAQRLQALMEETGLQKAFACFRHPCVWYYRWRKPYLSPATHRRMQLAREGRYRECLELFRWH